LLNFHIFLFAKTFTKQTFKLLTNCGLLQVGIPNSVYLYGDIPWISYLNKIDTQGAKG